MLLTGVIYFTSRLTMEAQAIHNLKSVKNTDICTISIKIYDNIASKQI